MKKEELYEIMEGIDESFINEAGTVQLKKKQPMWIKWGAMAACLCLVVVTAFALHNDTGANTIQKWNAGYSADDYFKYCNTGTGGNSSDSASLDLSAFPYAETRYFSDKRGELETNGVIPVIDSHPLFNLAARYNEDGSLYCVELFWGRRSTDGVKDYSDLKVLAGFDEIPVVKDCIDVAIDENGNILEPEVTVTERDGIQIVARGREDAEKSLTFQTDKGWYHISASWNDSYASLVEVFDWFWEHPLDFNLFPITAGDNYTNSTISETPDAFIEYIPDFESFGFIEESTYVSLKNGMPVHYEGHYVAHAAEEMVKNHDYYDATGYTTMHWCILGEPDIYDLDGCLGDIRSLTKEQVINILTNENNKIKFMQDDLLIIVYPSNAEEAWKLIESLL
ncbi:MAG: hypothetical protein PUC30_05055 [Lachnospiraceae bacterium]|nr:hypothetical protein [Lachnospiraceae bacterium]